MPCVRRDKVTGQKAGTAGAGHLTIVDPAVALRAILIWSHLHGLVSLEIAGNFASMGIDPGQLFEVQLPALTA